MARLGVVGAKRGLPAWAVPRQDKGEPQLASCSRCAVPGGRPKKNAAWCRIGHPFTTCPLARLCCGGRLHRRQPATGPFGLSARLGPCPGLWTRV
eukprot:1895891-Alexandrium_andersonii.AAC.1